MSQKWKEQKKNTSYQALSQADFYQKFKIFEDFLFPVILWITTSRRGCKIVLCGCVGWAFFCTSVSLFLKEMIWSSHARSRKKKQ
jgi:hypothetical protein